MFVLPQPTTAPYNTSSSAFTTGPGLQEMRAKSGQIVCERQKGETTGARATVMPFAKTTTCQSHTNTNLHSAAYCQISAAPDLHIQILREVSPGAFCHGSQGSPSRAALEQPHRGCTLRDIFTVRCCWRRALVIFSGLLHLKSTTSFLPCPQLILDQMKGVWEQVSLKWPHAFRFCTNVKRMYYSDKSKLATTEKLETLQIIWSPISRVKWNSIKPKLISEQRQFGFNCKYTPHYHSRGITGLTLIKISSVFSHIRYSQ